MALLVVRRESSSTADLKKNEMRETLIYDDGILARCVLCRNDEAFIHNWQTTDWADGPMEPVAVEFERTRRRL